MKLSFLKKVSTNRGFLFNLLVFLVVSLIFVSPYASKDSILAYGDSSIYLNPSYLNYHSMWEDHLNLGSFGYHQSNIFLFDFFWVGFSFFARYLNTSASAVFLFRK